MSQALTESEFERLADAELHALEAASDDLDGVEISLQMGILTLEFPGGARYIVNSHRAAKQIWMAAELNAWHFDYEPATKRWIAAKSGDELWKAVADVTSRKLGREVTFRR